MFTLYLWTVVAMTGHQSVPNRAFDWRPAGEYASQELCENGARQLGVLIERFRCIKTR